VSRFAWLTPDDIPDTVTCRVISFPDSEEWLATLSGALLLLTEEQNWEEFGSVSPEAAAAAMWDMWEDFVSGGCMRVGDLKASLRVSDYGPCWLECDGTLYQVADYPELYDQIGNTFGGVAGTSFRVPDLSGRAVIGEQGGVPQGSYVGSATHTLTASEMPQHSHSEQGVTLAASAIGEIPATALISSPTVTGNAGGGQAHNNVPPSMAVTWLIKAL
jgi:microcystin-dependent protein